MEGVAIEQGQYGAKAVLQSPWRQEMAALLTSQGIAELELNDGKGWRGEDISFLRELPQLQALHIASFNHVSDEPVQSLRALKNLHLSTYCKTPIDFSAFPELDHCYFEWRAGSNSLFGCKGLKTLCLVHYSGKDTDPFGALANLERVFIASSPVRSLKGLSGLKSLNTLRIALLRRLESLNGVGELEQLEELDVNTCRAIQSISEVAPLRNLKRLFLSNDGDIESLSPVRGLQTLEVLTFVESTNILDGDLSPLLSLRNLRRLSFQNRRHYSHKREQFPAYTGA